MTPDDQEEYDRLKAAELERLREEEAARQAEADHVAALQAQRDRLARAADRSLAAKKNETFETPTLSEILARVTKPTKLEFHRDHNGRLGVRIEVSVTYGRPLTDEEATAYEAVARAEKALNDFHAAMSSRTFDVFDTVNLENHKRALATEGGRLERELAEARERWDAVAPFTLGG